MPDAVVLIAPIVSGDDLIAASLAFAMLGPALAEPLPVQKPPGPGGSSCPYGYYSSGSFCVPFRGAQDAIAKPANRSCPFGWTSSDPPGD